MHFNINFETKGVYMKKLGIIYLISVIVFNHLHANNLPFSFPEVEGWDMKKREQVYYPDNLWDLINGAADLYLQYDFVDLHLADYSNESGDRFTLEIYRHKNTFCAYGMYIQERMSDAELLKIGAQGYQYGSILNFFIDDYYIKINGHGESQEMTNVQNKIAQKLAGNINPSATLPKIIGCFPEEGKILNSEKFINTKFMGHEFMHSAFTAKYEVEGKKYELFIIENPDPDMNHKILEEYLKFTKQPTDNIKEGYYLIKDKYNGDISIQWQGTLLWGVMNLDDEQKRKALIKDVKNKLIENKFIIIP